MKTKRVQRWSGKISALTACMILTGCSSHTHEWHEATCMTPMTCATCGETEGETLGHTWTEASCSTPKTCSICGETEGESLGHTWTEASCSAPKTCLVCGVTEGEVLEHTLTEANYQQAATCEVCGETVGEPLQADFEKYNFAYVTEVDKAYPFIIKCYSSDDLTSGSVIFSDCQAFASDDEHETKEGYEWKAVTATFIFDDENALKNGVGNFSYIQGDYYYDTAFDEEEATDLYTVNYEGVDYTECKFESKGLKNENERWIERDDGTAYYEDEYRYFFRVPVGYDGCTISIMNSEIADKINNELGGEINSMEDAMIYLGDENTITFRLK